MGQALPLSFAPSDPPVLPAEAGEAERPVMVCLLGGFRLLRAGCTVPVRVGSKAEALLSHLALRHDAAVPRAALLDALWPEADGALAGQSLSTLIYSLHKLVGGALAEAPLVTHDDGGYRLNGAAGVAVDIVCFDELLARADVQRRAGQPGEADALYARALALYRGDLQSGPDVHAIIERERLRAHFLNALARLADAALEAGDYGACLAHALRLLASEPCREDAHRLAMRCYVRRGERAQALRQYRLCEQVLRLEFDIAPELATRALFEQARTDPASV
jgi:DNA-binding SARP family transcriptional activator